MVTRRRAEASRGAQANQEEQEAVVPGQSLGRPHQLERHGAREQSHRGDPIAHPGAAGSGVRPAARPAHHGEPIDAERLGQRSHVGGPVQQAPSGLEGRPADSRPVRRDEPHAQIEGGLVGRGGVQPGAQTAVKAQDGIAGRIAVHLIGELPAVGQGHRRSHRRPAGEPAAPEGPAGAGPGAKTRTQARYRVML